MDHLYFLHPLVYHILKVYLRAADTTNVVVLNIRRAIDNVQKHNNCVEYCFDGEVTFSAISSLPSQ
jgi:hypothetical protein